MRWSLRYTLLAIVLPLTAVTLGLASARIAELLTLRADVVAFRDGAFRALYAERYARQLQALLEVSFHHVAGRGAGIEEIDAERARIIETLVRLNPYVHEGLGDANGFLELDSETLAGWEDTQEQIDIHLGRAVALAQRGDAVGARRLVMDELEVLVHGRVFSTVDRVIQGEQELLEELRIRIERATQNGVAGWAGAFDLREALLPDLYEAMLAERFARSAHADLKAFEHHVLGGKPLDASHGLAASQTVAQLERLQRKRAGDGESDGEPAASHALVREAYSRTLSLPPAARGRNALAVVSRVDELFEQSLMPQVRAIVWAHEQSVERGMQRLERFSSVLLAAAAGVSVLVLALALGSPWLASRVLYRPVIDLLVTVRRFREGKKAARPRLRPANELGLLARSLGSLLDELQESDRKVQALALYDSTTGLPNRQFFEERLAGALVTARLQERSMGLLTVSVIGLKQVTETLGHGATDELIRQVAARLRESLRLSDVISRPADKAIKTEVSRFGGDEFMVLLTRISKASDAAIAAQRVLARLTEPYGLEGREFVLGACIGIGVYPQDGGEPETLMRSASAALTGARKRGGNSFQFFSEAMNVANSRKLHIQSRLAGAIERDDLVLHYQPLRDSVTGRLSGAEALLRWVDSELGPIGPEEFIPIAEHTGIISNIGRWVLGAACAQAAAWREAGFPELRMSVNVSASQLREADWVGMVAAALKKNRVSAAQLELEITETTIIEDDPRTLTALSELSEMGVGIVLDDFGTGYSSLSNLRRLPICRVKIDRSFVSEIDEQGGGGALTQAIIALAHSMKLAVVAEGVETEVQARFLRSSRCDELQGYLISRAVTAAEFERFMQRGKSPSS